MKKLNPLVGLQTNDDNLRFLVEQLNLRIRLINENQDSTNSAITTATFDVDTILVNKDGAVLTSEDGEVLISG
jgi:hypothetical protein